MIAPPVRNKEMFVVAGAREQRSGEGKDAQAGGRLLARVSQRDLPRLLRGVLPDSAEGAFAEADETVFYVMGGENAAHFIKRQPLCCAARVDGHARLQQPGMTIGRELELLPIDEGTRLPNGVFVGDGLPGDRFAPEPAQGADGDVPGAVRSGGVCL